MRNKLFVMIGIISILFMTSFQVYASDIIKFSDPNLKSAILTLLNKNPNDEITIKESESIQFLSLSNKNIECLEGLQYFKNLNHLQLHQNQIKDLTPLNNLTKLQILTLNDNFIQDISPLSNLVQLKSLNLSHNKVKDLTPLKNLPILYYLYLANNNLTDLSEISHLKELDLFDYSGNHIYDISPITGLTELRYGDITNETIYLPTRYIKKGDKVSIKNPIKDESGYVRDIIVENGVYDEASNLVIWEEIEEDQTLAYTFSKTIPYPKYNGYIEFSGTVYVDVVVQQDQLPILSGVEDLSIPLGKVFNLLEGVTAYDAEDGNLTDKIKVEGKVDASIPGEYELIYSVTDSKNQITTANRLITVYPQDSLMNQRPVIVANDRILKKGATFDLLKDVIAYDAEDGDLTSKIEIINNTVNLNEVGIYEVTYQVSDRQGDTTTLTIKIEVREIPETGYSLFN